ncbi:MAG TPA: hypothetical protein VKX25_07260 [Bryobacteraceae bacterium]|jgi:hypothetical protein|nr:hypothetical protein [Bryobacteraceae bacterium]
MTLYSAILFLHVLATLGIVGALVFEAIALWQVRRVDGDVDTQTWLGGMPGMRVLATVCLLFLLLSGGYLTDRLAMWQRAWPKVAVGIVLAFGALAGISARRLNRARRAFAEGAGRRQEALRQVQAPMLKVSLSVRVGLLVAAVFLMTTKPNAAASLIATLACVLICWLGALPRGQKLHLNRQRGGSVEKRAHQQSI